MYRVGTGLGQWHWQLPFMDSCFFSCSPSLTWAIYTIWQRGTGRNKAKNIGSYEWGLWKRNFSLFSCSLKCLLSRGHCSTRCFMQSRGPFHQDSAIAGCRQANSLACLAPTMSTVNRGLLEAMPSFPSAIAALRLTANISFLKRCQCYARSLCTQDRLSSMYPPRSSRHFGYRLGSIIHVAAPGAWGQSRVWGRGLYLS